jgi:hypothetical protein
MINTTRATVPSRQPCWDGRGLSRIGAALAAVDDPLPPELGGLITDPVTWIGVLALIGPAIGILWLMETKSGLGSRSGSLLDSQLQA